MTADFGYRLMQFISSKSQMGYLKPVDFNLVINQGQNSFLDYLLGEFQQYQYGKGQPRVSYSQNETIRNRLTPIIYGYVLHVDPYGFAPYMGDYQQMDAMWSIYGTSIYGATIYGNKRVKYVQQDALYSYLSSRITPVSRNPIYLLEDKGFRFFPNNIYEAKASYVRKPPAIVWAFTEDTNERAVYDPANSVDFIWFESDCLEIISRALKMLGINLQSSAIEGYANDIIKNGQ